MKVIWTPEAEQDREDVWDYIATDNVGVGVGAAARMDAPFSDAAAQSADFPNIGRPGKITGTRELIPHENYRIVYEIEGKTVWVLAVVHTARQWPSLRTLAMAKAKIE